MYGIEEAKKIRQDFWDRFKNYSAVRRKQKGLSPVWIMNKTRIPQLKLKFEFDNKQAVVGIDIETRNLEKRLDLFGKLEEFRNILTKTVSPELIWELDYILENGKTISRIYLLKENVSIYKKEDWPEVFPFFYKNMMKIESFFLEYREVLKI